MRDAGEEHARGPKDPQVVRMLATSFLGDAARCMGEIAVQCFELVGKICRVERMVQPFG
jgi:hypothetical protein